MKISRLRTIAVSAYVSGMLLSTVAAYRSDATLASAIDPKLVNSMIAGLGGSPAAMPEVAAPAAVSFSPAPKAATEDPVITEELMARLIKRSMASQAPAAIDAHVARAFLMNDGSADVPSKAVAAKAEGGQYLFVIPLIANSNDIVVGFKTNNTIEAYLTDKTGRFRAATVFDGTTANPVAKEDAIPKFKSNLKFFAKIAEALPPTGGAAVASNGAGS